MEKLQGWVSSFNLLWDTEDTIKLLGSICGFLYHELNTIKITRCFPEKCSFLGSRETTNNNQPTTNKMKPKKLSPGHSGAQDQDSTSFLDIYMTMNSPTTEEQLKEDRKKCSTCWAEQLLMSKINLFGLATELAYLSVEVWV